MYKFRKKPVEIEAFQMTKERRLDNSEWPQWLHAAWNLDRHDIGCLQVTNFKTGEMLPDDPSKLEDRHGLEIVTLEGLHRISWGDYIIQGLKGELYPCKPDIFEMTYDSL